MSIRITAKTAEIYNADGELVVWELHHTNSRKSAAYFLHTVCEVYGIDDEGVNEQILATIRGE